MGWVNFFLAENESHIYPNMCAKFGCGPTVVSTKKGGGGYRQTDRQADRQTKISAALYSRLAGYPASLGREGREGEVEGAGGRRGGGGREGSEGREGGRLGGSEGGKGGEGGRGERDGGWGGREGREGGEGGRGGTGERGGTAQATPPWKMLRH